MSEALSTPSNDTELPRVVGISIEPLQVACVSRSLDAEDSGVFTAKTETPPCILLPRLPREPLRLQQAGPRHPRGTGNVWPPEASLPDDILQSPIVPLGLVWNALSREALANWSWTMPKGETHSASPAELIAAAVAGVVPRVVVGSPVLVIPNDLKMKQQQAIIDACSQQELRVKLLWRPIAAALSWCEQHAAAVLKQHASVEGSIGMLLVLHLGIDQFELTPLELVVQKQGRKRLLLPARRRPKVATLPSCGVDWLMSTTTGSRAEAWHELWTTNSIEQRLQSSELTLEAFFDDADPSNWRSSLNNQWLPPALSRSQFDAWLRSHREALPQQPLLGVVVTGEFAHVSLARKVSLWRHVLSTQGIAGDVPRLLIDRQSLDTVRDISAIGSGALRYAAAVADGDASYLDTLPRIRLDVKGRGATSKWQELLDDSDEFVVGGKLWRRGSPLTGLGIKAGKQRVELTLNHEEFDTVRQWLAEWPKPASQETAIELHVSLEPAQGNARVDVIPINAVEDGMRRIRLDWDRMADTEKTAEQWMAEKKDRSFPAILRRAASPRMWSLARQPIQQFLTSNSTVNLLSVVDALKARDSLLELPKGFEGSATAFSSDGLLDEGPSHLQRQLEKRLIESLTETVLKPEVVVRALAYSSSDERSWLRFLDKLITTQKTGMDQDSLRACGWCLRDPRSIAKFSEVLERFFHMKLTAPNNWLRSFAEMLRYREDATRDIPTERCERLTEHFLKVFRQQCQDRNPAYLFRNSSMCMVYLLRRRAYDDNFLAKGSDLYNRVRCAFLAALRDVRSKKLRPIGGLIKLEDELKKILKFIKRAGGDEPIGLAET